ncbi:hypothetical protein TWF730_001632 [Orbilia blumenaviensis]|uniref:DUF7726 domain-containing protein n=1 Tax=Orbilia blumenaviensis TaxID=1796055 RepID=A0AAV9UPH3_9PEZI
MPPKRKSTEANLENNKPAATSLLQAGSASNDAKRAKITQNAPLGDISNSPWPIKWTAFGTGKYVEDPLRPVAPIDFSVPEENEDGEGQEAAVGPVEEPVEEAPVAVVEAPVKKATKRAATKKTTPRSNATAAEPTTVELVTIPEPEATIEPAPAPEEAPAPTKRSRKTAAKKATPKGASKPAGVAPVEPVAAPEVPAAEPIASTKAKKTPAKKATPKSAPKAMDPAPVVEESDVTAEADTAKAKKPIAKKAASKAKAKAPEPAPVDEEVVVVEPTKPAKKATKSKAKAKAAEEPTPTAEPEAPAPAPAKKAAKATKQPKEPAPKAAKPAKGALPEFITTVELDGEDDDTVPVFDTCDVIRRKITGALTSGHTKAFLLRAFAASTSEPDRAIAPNSFQRFMAAKGKTGGCANRTFYAAYVYFEKQRIAEKKKKTKTREEMEEAWGPNGMDYENIGKPVLVLAGESLSSDQYGRMVLTSGGRSSFL